MNSAHNVGYRALSADEINKIMDDARQLQAQAFRDSFVAIARGTASIGRRIWSRLRLIATSLSEAVAARKTYEQLSRLTERELADIGLTRGEIAEVAAGLYRRQSTAVLRTAKLVPPKAAVEQDNVEQRYREAA